MTITTLRPSSTVFQSAVVPTSGGAAAWSVVDDDPVNDSTLMQADRDRQYIRFGCTDITLTAGQRVKACRIRIRNARDASGGTTQDTITSLHDNRNTALGKVAAYTSTRGLTSIVTSTGPWSYKAPGNVAWSESIVDNIGIQVQWFQVHVGTPDVFQRVYELYVDVDVNNQPVITGTPVVTNYTDNATPTVSWDYFDADNDNQAAYRVKFFDSATYGAGNFSPDSSPAAWDSGEVISGGDDATVPASKALLNGVTYKAYVRAAQTWPGPQGRYWWTDWAASAAFTVTFTPPLAPSVSASVLADLNAYRAMVTADVPVNLLAVNNASFEADAGFWTQALNMSAPVVTGSGYKCGTKSMVMKSVAAGEMQAICALDLIGEPVVDVNKQITIIGSFKAWTVARSCSVGLRWLNSSGGTISTQWGANVTDVAGGAPDANWTQAFLTTNVPAGAVNARAMARVLATGAGGEIHLFDCASVHAGDSTTWTLGGLVNDQGDLLVERGERVDGRRGPARNWLHPQVGSAGSVLRNHGAGFNATAGDVVGWFWLDKAIPEPGQTPPGMIRWYPASGAGSWFEFASWFFPPQVEYLAPAVPSQLHVASIWAWVDTGTLVVRPDIVWRTSAEGVDSTTTGPQYTLTTTPQRIWVTGTCPSTAVYACVKVNNVPGSNDKHVFFTRAGWGLGSSPVDGDPPRGGPLVWTPIRFPYDEFASFPTGFTTQQRNVYADYDYPSGRPVLYRASMAYGFAGTVINSPLSNYATAYAAPPAQTLLRSPTEPMLQVVVARRKAASFSIDEDAQVFRPLGADGTQVKVSDWIGGEDGQLVVVTSNESQYARLRALIDARTTLQIQWAQGGHTYCLVTRRGGSETLSSDVDWCDADGQQGWIRHVVHTLDYVETSRP